MIVNLNNGEFDRLYEHYIEYLKDRSTQWDIKLIEEVRHQGFKAFFNEIENVLFPYVGLEYPELAEASQIELEFCKVIAKSCDFKREGHNLFFTSSIAFEDMYKIYEYDYIFGFALQIMGYDEHEFVSYSQNYKNNTFAIQMRDFIR